MYRDDGRTRTERQRLASGRVTVDCIFREKRWSDAYVTGYVVLSGKYHKEFVQNSSDMPHTAFLHAMQYAENLAATMRLPIRVTPIALGALVAGRSDAAVGEAEYRCHKKNKWPWFPPIDIVESVVALVLANDYNAASEILNQALAKAC